MLRLLLFFLSVAAIAFGLSWLADHPGQIVVNWEGREIEISVFHAVIALAFLSALLILSWSAIRQLVASPRAVSGFLRRRQQNRGLDALSTGIIAVGAGDAALATRYAGEARRSLPNEPLTDLLRAQSAQLTGDYATARRIYEAMLAAPDTELLGLRGLFLEAMREDELAAARQFCDRAVRINPKIDWPVNALFELQCRASDWPGALETLAIAKKHGHVERPIAHRRRAVLLTAQALAAEESDMDRALTLALEAHKLAPDLVPAGEIAGRVLASKGNTAKAASVIAKTWKRAPHPDLAAAYAYARPGDSPKDRLKRVKSLASTTPHNVEAPIAVANAAIEARDWDGARLALQPLLDKRQTQRVCTLMARIEGGQYGDRGRVREWLARAVHAPRDPAWTADGVVSEHWAAISPVTGELDAFEWKVAVEALEKPDTGNLLEQLMPLAIVADAAVVPSRLEPENGPIEEAVVVATTVPDVEAVGSDSAPEPESAAEPPPRDDSQDDGDNGDGDRGDELAEKSGTSTVKAPAPPQEEPSAPVADRPQIAALAPVEPKRRGGAESGRVFVPPRAPDDPGPDAGDPDEARTPLARFRMSPVKGQV